MPSEGAGRLGRAYNGGRQARLKSRESRMRCSSIAVSQVMVGLHRVGIVGLHGALVEAERSGLESREALVDLLRTRLARDNYIPERQREEYDVALWREYLRHRGADFREFFSPVQVTVRGEPGEERDRLVTMATSTFAHFELKPLFQYEPPQPGESEVRLLIGEHEIARGCPSEDRFKLAVRRSLSDW